MRILLLLLVTTAAGAQSQFTGSNACKTCHADVWMNFYKNPHYKSIASGKEPAEKTGCEGCHGPAHKRLEAHGGKTTIPRAFSLMNPKQVLDTCLGCHARDLARANIQRSEHTKNDVACTSCHSVHHAATPKYLLAKKQSELCYGCHATVRAQFSMPSKHRVNEGFMQCTDCHNPHGSFDATSKSGQKPRSAAPKVPRAKAGAVGGGPPAGAGGGVRDLPQPARLDERETAAEAGGVHRSEEHTSELQSLRHLVCRLLLA